MTWLRTHSDFVWFSALLFGGAALLAAIAVGGV